MKTGSLVLFLGRSDGGVDVVYAVTDSMTDADNKLLTALVREVLSHGPYAGSCICRLKLQARFDTPTRN